MAELRLFAIHESDPLHPQRTVVSQPPAETVMTTEDDSDVFVVRVDSAALEDALETRLGYSVCRPLRLAATLRLGTAAGQRWAALVRLVLHTAPGRLLTNPMIAEPLQHAVLDGLLWASDHPYRDALDTPV